MTDSDNRPYISTTHYADDHPAPDGIAFQAAPPVLVWYKAFCIASALMYGAVLLMGLAMLILPAFFNEFMTSSTKGMEDMDRYFNMAMGAVYVLMGLIFMLVYLAGAFVPARPWGWVTGIVLIALTFTSCCCIPLAIPLLIFWIKPEAKAFFYAS